jgi:hypothetical protein
MGRIWSARFASLLALMLFAAACSSSSSKSSSTASSTRPGLISNARLASQTARSGTWKPEGSQFVLTFDGVSPVTMVYGNTTHTVSTLETSAIVEGWRDAFGGEPVAAAVQLADRDKQRTVLVHVSQPLYDPKAASLTFTASAEPVAPTGSLASFDVSSDPLPASFGTAAVFLEAANAKLPQPKVTADTGGKVAPCVQQGDVGTDPLNMSLVNSSGVPDNQVYVALTGKVLAGYQKWDASPRDLVNTSVPLSCLPKDPEVKTGHAYTFRVSKGVSAGLVWISYGTKIAGLPATQPSFDTADFRFANTEFAYPGQGDMTNVDQFSFPIDLDVFKPRSTKAAASSHYRADTCTIVGALKKTVAARKADGGNVAQTIVKDGNGKFVRVVSPKQRAKQLAMNGNKKNPYAQGWPSLEQYLGTLAGTSLTVKGLFTPGVGSPHYDETGWYSYTAKLDANANVTMTGTIKADVKAGPGGKGATAGAPVTIAAAGTDTDAKGGVVANDGLLTGLYDQNSRYAVDSQPRNGMSNGVAEPAAPNDVYNSIYRDFVTAFTYGYWGGKYGDDNTKFWGSFKPPAAPTGGRPGFAPARPATDRKGLLAFNVWSQIMFTFSDNYNIPYGEDYGSGASKRPSPLLDIPVGGTWRMTIKPDGKPGCLNRL